MQEQTLPKNTKSDIYEYEIRRAHADYDACAVLGIDRTKFFSLNDQEQQKEAKRCFRKKAQELHPDTAGSDEHKKQRANQEFRELNQAYAFLTNPKIKDSEKKFFESQDWVNKNAEEAVPAATVQEEAPQDIAAKPSVYDPDTYQSPTSSMTEEEALRIESLMRLGSTIPKLPSVKHLESSFWREFVGFYKQKATLQDDAIRESTDFKEEQKRINKALKVLTTELADAHKTPKPMFNLYMRALASLAKEMVFHGTTTTLKRLQTFPQFKLIESYQQLMRGTLAVAEIFDEHSLTLFDKQTTDSGAITYTLKENISEEDMDELDKQLQSKI